MSTLGFCDLTISYDGVCAVNGFNDILHSGEWLCLIGPNGAGKSSVLRAAAGLINYSGSVAIDQKEIPTTSARWRAQNIAFVPQTPLMPDDMSVVEYVLLGRNPYIKHFASESTHDLEVVEKILHRLDLEQFSNRMVGTLSGGERQRAVIARALAQEAPVLLLDEPCSALDPGSTLRVEETIVQLSATMTIVIVTHNMQQAARVSDYCAFFLSDGGPGQLVEADLTTNIFSNPSDTRTADYVQGRFG